MTASPEVVEQKAPTPIHPSSVAAHSEDGLLWFVIKRVLRRDVIFAIIPLIVSVVITVFYDRKFERVLVGPDCLFATIVFLGIALTQTSDRIRRDRDDSDQSE